MFSRFRLFVVLVMAVFVSSAVFMVGAQDATATTTAEASGFTRLNLNTASGDEFLTIPDMNNRMVREYMEYRPYVSILQFRQEIGKYVGDVQVAAWEPYVYVPIQIDEADVETLKQIPGVDDTIANELIAGRPYGTNEAFIAKLATVLTAEQMTLAPNYLDGYVPTEATPEATVAPEATAAAEATVEAFTRINLNTGTGDEFLTIPDMNNRMVREYMEYRPYVSILQFRQEIGKYVGDVQVAAWEPFVFVPVQIDQADVETLKQIPGVDDTIANELIAARPYSTNDAFLAKLATYLSAEQVAFAQNFLDGYTPSATATPAG